MPRSGLAPAGKDDDGLGAADLGQIPLHEMRERPAIVNASSSAGLNTDGPGREAVRPPR